MFYDKQIKYLDLYDKGEKVQNAGFVRLEARDDKVNLQLRAEKLRHTDSGRVQVVLEGVNREAVLGELMLESGRGVLEYRGLPLQNMAEDIGYEELHTIYLRLPGERSLKCIVKERRVTQEEEVETYAPQEPDISKNTLEAAMITEPEVFTEPLVLQASMPKQIVPQSEYASQAESISGQLPPVPQTKYVSEPGSMTEQMPFVAPQTESVPNVEQLTEEEPVQQSESDMESVLEQYLISEAPLTSKREKMPDEVPMPGQKPVSRAESVPARESVPSVELMPGQKSVPSAAPIPRRKPAQRTDAIQEREPILEPMPRAERIPRSMSEPGPVLRPMPTAPIQERQSATTKWQQLSNIYPHIRPFEDGRDYLKIKPEDFVILTKKYYPLATNSFLKHGYYNYEHLILTREMRKDGERFYIGVPGNFYEKEKQVAVLFGFESFEGKEEPARNGDFGYYMISVEI